MMMRTARLALAISISLVTAMGAGCEPEPLPLPTERIDSGFLVTRDAFAFPNFGGVDTASRMTDIRLTDLHAKEEVCLSASGDCALRPIAKEYLRAINKSIKGGRCEGFAVLAGLMFDGQIDPNDFGAATPHEMNIDETPELGAEIAYWFGTQYLQDVVMNTTQPMSGKEAVQFLTKEYGTEGHQMYRMGLARLDENNHLTGGHAILPVAVGPGKGADEFIIYLYDNNHPDEETEILVNAADDTWQYNASTNPDDPAAAYIGNPDNGNFLYMAEIRPRLGRHPCSFCNDETGEAALQQVFGSAGVEVAASDESEATTGEVNGRILTEIPGSKATPLFTASMFKDDTGSQSFIPVNGTLTMAIRSSGTKESEGPQDVVLVAGATIAALTNFPLGDEGTSATLEVNVEEGTVSYTPAPPDPDSTNEGEADAGDGTITFGTTTPDGQEVVVSFEVPAEGTEQAGVSVDPETGNPTVVLVNDEVDTVVVSVVVADETGESSFTGEVPAPEGGSSTLLVDEWEGEGTDLGAEVDNDGDGENDESVSIVDEGEAPPDAPSDLRVIDNALGRIELAWSDNGTTETGFDVQRDDGTGFAVIASLAIDSTTFEDTTVVPLQSYRYRVGAVANSGASQDSNVIDVIAAGCPAGQEQQGTACVDCTAGSFCAGDAAPLVPCETGTFDDDDSAATPCAVCPADLTCAGGADAPASCAAGFLGDGIACVNVDECLAGNGGCAQTCTDSDGSFACSCEAGFTLNADDLSCDDVDECSTSNGGCAQTCTNESGAFACSCEAGFTLNGDGATCDDVDECATNNGGCDAAFFTCANNAGGVPTCVDINECATNNGGCGDATVFTCANNAGGVPTCADINECATNNGGCDAAFFTCTNNAGVAPTCVDINECNTSNGGCAQTCFNDIGSRTCACNSGFDLNVDGVSCDSTGPTQPSCLQHLVNGAGPIEDGLYNIDPDGNTTGAPFEVYCDMTTDGGGYTFLKVAQELQDFQAEDFCAARGMRLLVPRTPDHYLSAIAIARDSGIGPVITPPIGGNEYIAMLGIYPDVQGSTCANQPLNSANPQCGWHPNDNGSFYINGDELPQNAIVGEPNGDNCTTCSMGYEYSETGVLNNYNDAGFDSHASSTHFICEVGDLCGPGFIDNPDGSGCSEVNECLTNNGGCEQECSNQPGSFVCFCNVGFELNGDGVTCDDIDECLTQNGGCAQTCNNEPGTFVCSCDPGLTLNGDGATCDDVNECDTNNGGCQETCNNEPGSFACSCFAGFVLAGNDVSCEPCVEGEFCPADSTVAVLCASDGLIDEDSDPATACTACPEDQTTVDGLTCQAPSFQPAVDWVFAYGGAADDLPTGEGRDLDVTGDASGHIYGAAGFEDGPFDLGRIFKLDDQGGVVWTKLVATAGDVGHMVPTRIRVHPGNGDLFVAVNGATSGIGVIGTLNIGLGNVSCAAFLARLDSANGNVVWGVPLGTNCAFVNDIDFDSQGNVWVGGSFTDTLTIGAQTITAVSPGHDGFVARFNPDLVPFTNNGESNPVVASGEIMPVVRVSNNSEGNGANNEIVNGLAVLTDGRLAVVGEVNGTGSADIGDRFLLLGGGTEAFYATFDPADFNAGATTVAVADQMVAIASNEFETLLSVHASPSSGDAYVGGLYDASTVVPLVDGPSADLSGGRGLLLARMRATGPTTGAAVWAQGSTDTGSLSLGLRRFVVDGDENIRFAHTVDSDGTSVFAGGTIPPGSQHVFVVAGADGQLVDQTSIESTIDARLNAFTLSRLNRGAVIGYHAASGEFGGHFVPNEGSEGSRDQFVAGLRFAGPRTSVVFNASFEVPALVQGVNTLGDFPGWTSVSGDGGVFFPPNGVSVIPAGNQVLFMNPQAVVEQTLATVFEADTKYLLTGTVYKRLDLSELSVVASLTSDSSTLAGQSLPLATTGDGTLFSLVFTVAANSPEIGERITLVLEAGTVGQQVLIDNLRLRAQSVFEPSCFALRQAGQSESGLYLINPVGNQSGGPFEVYCDMTTDGGGYTFLKVLQASTEDTAAEAFCAVRGMRMLVPSTPAHLESALTIARDPTIGPDASDNYMFMLGIYPLFDFDNNGAFTCNQEHQSLNSGSETCEWRANDGGSFFVRGTTNGEPNGDNCPQCSMDYAYGGITSGQPIDVTFNDINGHQQSERFTCDLRKP